MRRKLYAAALPLIALAASPAAAAAVEINENFKPQNEFKLDPWVPIEIFGIDMSINKGVLYVVIAGLLTTITMIVVARKMKTHPNRMQTAVELFYTGLRDTVTRGNIHDGKVARRWFPFLATLFLFIWISNVIGYIPLPTNSEHPVNVFGVEVPTFALYAATANLAVPLVLTLIVWISYHVEGIRAKGPVGYVKSWIPGGISGPILILVAPIEVLSQFVRLISLSARLFANMLAGHLLILIMGGGLAVLLGSWIVGVFTLPVAVAFFLFEVGLVVTLQAFIFVTLSAIYIGSATGDAH